MSTVTKMAEPTYFPPEEYYLTQEEVLKVPFTPIDEEVCVGLDCADFKNNTLYRVGGPEIMELDYSPSVPPIVEDESRERIYASASGNVQVNVEQIRNASLPLTVRTLNAQQVPIVPPKKEMNWKMVGAAALAIYLLGR